MQAHGLLGEFVVQSSSDHNAEGRPNILFSGTDLNAFASLDRQTRISVREKIIELVSDPRSTLYIDLAFNARVFVPVLEAIMHLPMQIGGFADFLTSKVHAENVRISCSMCSLPPKPPGIYCLAYINPVCEIERPSLARKLPALSHSL